MNKKNYSYKVMWSEDTLKYVGYCLEYPSLSYVDSDPVETLKGIIKVVNSYEPKTSKFLSETALLQDLNLSNAHSELLSFQLTDKELGQ
ncbi:hypothetical protein AY606_12570 [Acinetobacter sp. SFB]|uniref:hypothetical protein n=1 Tax=Acinetobacter sp. SFB TaxID=1805634 RepID=UPI0007D8187B|nr:hypothetical protein [Acinetobacter sp. SFB]OAL76795.1 hypothetical protein AY606_12570 [Acinetobacter sp. SFB]